MVAFWGIGLLCTALSKMAFVNVFSMLAKTQEHADDSMVAGRKFVEAYVLFTHYVEGLHAIIKGSGGHHGEDAKGNSGHDQ